MGNQMTFITYGGGTNIADLRIAISIAQAKSLDFNGDTKILAFNQSPIKESADTTLTSRIVLQNTDEFSFISTYQTTVPQSRVGWWRPITEDHLSGFLLEETNPRGYVAQEVD